MQLNMEKCKDQIQGENLALRAAESLIQEKIERNQKLQEYRKAFKEGRVYKILFCIFRFEQKKCNENKPKRSR